MAIDSRFFWTTSSVSRDFTNQQSVTGECLDLISRRRRSQADEVEGADVKVSVTSVFGRNFN